MSEREMEPAEAAVVQVLEGSPGLAPEAVVRMLEEKGTPFSTRDVRRALWNLIDHGDALFTVHRRIALRPELSHAPQNG